MFKYKVTCPHCGKELTYHILHRDWDRLVCSHCQTPYVVNMRMLVIVVMLFIFMICQQVYAMFLSSYISIAPALIMGVLLVFFMSNVVMQIIAWKLGTQLFFETEIKKSRAKGKKETR